MEKLAVIVLAIIEFIVYTFSMALIGEIIVDNPVLKLLIHFASLTVLSIIIYYLLCAVFNLLKLKAKKYIYHTCIWNLSLGIIFPILLIIIIPNDGFTTFAFFTIICTCYYGIFINILVSILNYFLTNRKRN